MFLSKRSNGIYYIFYKSSSGKITCKSTKCKLKSDAMKFFSEFGKDLQTQNEVKTFQISMNDFFFEYLKYSESIHSLNHTKSLKITFKSLINFLSIKDILELNHQQIQSFTDYRLKNVSNLTVRRDLANLSSAFNWGISKNFLLLNHCKNIKKPKIVEKIPAFFSEQDLERLLAAVRDNDLKDLIRFVVNTGLRQSEVINLKWNQINFKDNYLILDNNFIVTKSKRVRTIPLNINALQILTERQIHKKSDFVFTYQGNQIKQLFISHKFRKLIRSAQLDSRLTFHSLRHTFASWLVQKGVSIFEISKLLGHSDIRVTQIYAHLKPENLRNAVDLLTDIGSHSNN